MRFWPKRKPPTDWRSTGEIRWRVLGTCDGYRLVRRQIKMIEFISCTVEWRDQRMWSPLGDWWYAEETRAPVQSAHDEIAS